MLIASRVRTNVSELEQCLARIATYASLHTQSIDESLAEMVRQQAFAEREQAVTAPRIQQTVAEHFGLKMSDSGPSSGSEFSCFLDRSRCISAGN